MATNDVKLNIKYGEKGGLPTAKTNGTLYVAKKGIDNKAELHVDLDGTRYLISDALTADNALNSTSENAVQNKVINAKFSEVEVELNKKAPKETGIYYIAGTGSIKGTWLGSDDRITSLYTGLTIAYKIPIEGGSSTTTLNINNWGAKTVYYNDTKLTTEYPINTIVILTYDGTYWKTVANAEKGPASGYTSENITTSISGSGASATVKIPQITVDKYGHVTAAADTDVTITMPTLPTSLKNPNALTVKGNGTQSFTYDGSSAKTLNIKSGTGTSVTSDTSGNITINHSNSVTAGTAQGDATKTLTFGGTFTIPTVTYDAQGHVTGKGTTTMTMPANPNTDTKNTTGSTNTSSKIFLVGATSQAANPQTYSHDTVYVGTDGYLYSNSLKVNPRIYTTLVPEGSAVPANANLNTVTYMRVGNYYCSSDATAETLTNAPTKEAFMLQVYSPLSTTIDNESGTWVYRIRKYMTYTGHEYIQYCYTNGTAGNWIYGAWLKNWHEGDKVTSAVWNDYAEFFPRGEMTTAGDIIALDLNSDKEQYIKAIKGNSAIVGVESDEYGFIVGGDQVSIEENMKNYIPVGLAGRVWVKVQGNPKKGDYIGASDIPGVGEVCDDKYNAIGICVDNNLKDGKCRIKII